MLFEHILLNTASLQNAVKWTELGSSLWNKISCWRWLDITIVRHPLYSSDFTPCNFCLFPKLKTPGESRFEDSEKVKSAVTFDDFHEAFTKWVAPYNKSIEVRASVLWRILQFCTSLKVINISAEEVSKLLECTSYFENQWSNDFRQVINPSFIF